MAIKTLYFNPNTFTVVKQKSTQMWFVVRTADTQFGEFESRGNEEIECIPIDKSGYLIEIASRQILRKDLDNNVFLPEAMFSY